MTFRNRFWTTLAAAALLAMPLGASAQTTSPTQSGQTGSSMQTQPYGQSSSSSLQSPTHYLDQARKDLDNLSTTAKASDAGKDLESHFTELRTAYESGSSTSSQGTETSGTSGSTSSSSSMSSSSDSWRTHYNKIQQILDSLNVPKSSAWVPSTSSESSSSTSGTGTTGSTSGTSGTQESTGASSTYSTSSFSASDLAQLKQFRQDIEMFQKAIKQ